MATESRIPGIELPPEEVGRIYRAFYEESQDVLLLQDEVGRIVDVNPRGAQLTGFSLAELRRMSVPGELAVPEDAEKVGSMLENVRHGHVQHSEIRWNTKDGRVVEFDVITVPIYPPGRRVVWTFCTLRDISERKAVERELRKSEERLRLILATLPVGVAVTDTAGDVVLINKAVTRIWGGDIIVSGRERWARTRNYWHDGGRLMSPSELASVRALSEGETTLNQLIDIETYDGKRKTLQNSAAPIRDEDGRLVGAVVVNEDVSKRVRAESELRSALEELKALSARLVQAQETERHELSRELHDRIGQNLTALSINLDTVKARLATEDPEIASRLRDSRVLLDATFAAMTDLLSELRPPMLDDLGLFAALEWYGKQFSRRTGLEVSVAGTGHARRTDAQAEIALFRIAQEALNNVARHANAKRVEIALTSANGEWALAISDDGVGLDTEANGMTHTREGFGMASMRERARAIGGRLEVRRRPEGGTSVLVRVASK